MYEISKQFWFEAAHTLERVVETESSRRIHGHSYRAEITLRGAPDPVSGMVLDMGLFASALEEVRTQLDHRFLDDVQDLGPATMENLARWIWDRLEPRLKGLSLVTIYRDSSRDTCRYFGPRT